MEARWVVAPRTPYQLLDFELLNTFTTQTCPTLTSFPSICIAYQTTVIAEALNYDYLLEIILAISAFHLASMETEPYQPVSLCYSQISPNLTKKELCLKAGQAHYTQAVRFFRRSLNNLQRNNCHALFACSGLVFIATLAQHHQDHLENPLQSSSPRIPVSSVSDRSPPAALQNGLDKVLHWMRLLRGINTILLPSMIWIEEGPFKTLLVQKQEVLSKYESGDIDPKVACHLDKYYSFLSRAEIDTAVAETCQAALASLRNSFAVATCEIFDHQSIFLWPVVMSDNYLTLLEARQPEALVILAYFSVLLFVGDFKWWINDWPYDTLSFVKENLDPKWDVWLQWPVSVIGLDSTSLAHV